MAGTTEGAIKAAETNKSRYGHDFYAHIGRKGGQKGAKDGVIKGFAAMDYEKRAAAGRKGGLKSNRQGVKTNK